MLAIALASALLNAPAPAATTQITARGSDSTIALVKNLAEGYSKSSGVTIKVEGGGSGKGADACAKGEVDFCFLSRELKEGEKTQGLVAKQYAFDGVAVIVNKSNPTSDVTIEDLRGWFSGKTTKWSDEKPIVAFNRNQDSGTREVFQDKVMKDAKFSDTAAVKHDGVIVSSVAKIATSVAFTSLGEVTGDVKVLKVNGVAPTHETIRNRTYPLTRTLTFATKGEAKPEVKAFIDWATNKEGQSQVAKAGYTAVSDQAVASVPSGN